MQPAATGGRPSGGGGAGNRAGSSAGGGTSEGGRANPDAGDASRPTPDAGRDSDVRACIDAASPDPLPDGGSCGPRQYLYVDQACDGPLPPDSSIVGTCTDVGDGRCHDRCASDGDCTDPCRPHCSILGLFDQGDYNCNAGVRICRAKAKDDCAHVL